jgi:nucleoside-diphosphate-sugar epimerase
MSGIFCLGCGYSAQALARKLQSSAWKITGTSRDEDKRSRLRSQGYDCVPFNSRKEVRAALASHDHILISIPPVETGDPVLSAYRQDLLAAKSSLRWLGYLSTTGVYGDRGGAWIDETAALLPTTDRAHRRFAAETDWLSLHAAHGLPVHIFRLAGIYGPGRNQLLALRAGTARRIVKPGQVFSRIHVDDIAGVLEASMRKPCPGRCYNVCDDEPAPPQDVVTFAAGILGLPPPPQISFDRARLTDVSRGFYEESKRVSNNRIKQELGYRLLYPSYREGLLALSATLEEQNLPQCE